MPQRAQTRQRTPAQREQRLLTDRQLRIRRKAEPLLGKNWWKHPSAYQINLDLITLGPIHMTGFHMRKGKRPRNTDETHILFAHIPGKNKATVPFGALRVNRTDWKELRRMIDAFFAPMRVKRLPATKRAKRK